MDVVAREDGRFEYQEQVYALAKGFPQFGLPGWSVPLRIKNIAVYRHYATYGSTGGDFRPPVSEPRLGGVAEIDGWINRVGVLGQPKTESTEFSVSIYPYDGANLGGSDWDKRARKSWPVSILRLTEAHEEFSAVEPHRLPAPGKSSRRLPMRCPPGAWNGCGWRQGSKDFTFWTSSDRTARRRGGRRICRPRTRRGQTAVLHGYISDLTVDESRLELKLNEGGASTPTSEPTPGPPGPARRARASAGKGGAEYILGSGRTGNWCRYRFDPLEGPVPLFGLLHSR